MSTSGGGSHEEEGVPIKEYVEALFSHVPARITIKDYIEALFQEKERALKLANEEREKAAYVLRDEGKRFADQAEKEKEKSAANLRTELARSISEGDERLREHITNQILQIREALISSDKLEQARIQSVTEALAGVQRELELKADASAQAILKAEKANEQRFESVNEFRAEARAVRESQQAALNTLSASLLPRETFDTWQKQQEEWRRQVEARFERESGQSLGAQKIRTEQGVTIGYFFAGLAALATLIGLIVAFANYVAS